MKFVYWLLDALEIKETEHERKQDEWLGMEPCASIPAPVPFTDADGDPKDNGYNFFTNTYEDRGMEESYIQQMRSQIAGITNLDIIGKGEYWNMYFSSFQSKPLSLMYHRKVHSICRKATVYE